MTNLKLISKIIGIASVLIGLKVGVAAADDISWNGFGSAYYGQAINAKFLPLGLTDTHPNFTSFSLLGLNLGARLDDNFSFSGQLLALGSPVGTTDAYGVIAQWAYLKYTPLRGTSFKGGRQLMPALMASEYARVGYLLPFRQIPIGMYTLPFTRFDGVSGEQAFDVGFGKFTVGAFFGSPLLDFNQTGLPAGNSFSLNDAIGLTTTLDGDGWRLRAMAVYLHTQENLANPPVDVGGTYDGHRTTYSLGGRYDKNNMVGWAEYIASATPDGTRTNLGGKYIEHGEGYYALVGYRLGNFMPRYTFSHGTNDFNLHGGPPLFANWNGEITSHTIGVNYQASSVVVVKVEYERQSIGGSNTAALFGVNQAATTKSDLTHGDAFYAGVDFIF